MSRALTGLGIIACLSPPLGGLLAGHLGWRATMVALCVLWRHGAAAGPAAF